MLSVHIITERSIPETGVLCMALAHNETKRVADFLRHYRAMGVAHFLILDDGSTDGTFDFLRTQTDVTLFVPRGTNYKDHKVAWRRDILDRYAEGRWVLVPDLDELLVYPHCDSLSIVDFARHLDLEGAEAVFAPMVEMYADGPLNQTAYQAGQSMLAAFPYFDVDGYRLVRPRMKTLLLYPTPPLEMYGGPRERLFYDFTLESLKGVRGWAVRRFSGLGRSMRPDFWARVGNTLARFALSGKGPRPALVMSKLAMVKWREGLRFSGGPHSISQTLKLSQVWGAFLHFKFMDIESETAYRIARKQHAAGSTHYRRVEQKGGFDRSPIYAGSRRYTSWRDLTSCGLLRSSRDWDLVAAPLDPMPRAAAARGERTAVPIEFALSAPSPKSLEKQSSTVPAEH